MNKNLPILSILIAVVLFVTAYSAVVVQAQASAKDIPQAAAYESILGKSLSDKAVDDFIVSNRCSGTGQFQVCKQAGVALWIGQDQKVETVYLYPKQVDGFGAYTGTLPFGLVAKDTRTSVEEKLGHPRVTSAPQAGWVPGLPDENAIPDHIHAWSMYKRFGVTIIYNSPSAADKGATIHSILVSK